MTFNKQSYKSDTVPDLRADTSHAEFYNVLFDKETAVQRTQCIDVLVSRSEIYIYIYRRNPRRMGADKKIYYKYVYYNYFAQIGITDAAVIALTKT